MKVKVPVEVLDGLEKIRRSGVTNMFDYHLVMRYAHDWDMHETVVWMYENKKLYVQGIFQGFEVEEEQVGP